MSKTLVAVSVTFCILAVIVALNSTSVRCRVCMSAHLLPNDLNHHPFRPPPIKLPIEYLLPRPEIQPPGGDRHDDLAAHDLPLHVGVGVVLAGAVVAIAVGRRIE